MDETDGPCSIPLRHEFLETSEGLIFAVLDDGVEDGRAICFLRYVRDKDGLRKVATAEANVILQRNHRKYLFHSRQRDAHLHGVPLDLVTKRHLPRERARELVDGSGDSQVAWRCARLLSALRERGVAIGNVGVTGSLLLGAETDASDIDLVMFGRDAFDAARQVIASAAPGKPITPLAESDWRTSYLRRGCELTFDEYVWHERRKHNKAIIEGTKFDISLVAEGAQPEAGSSVVSKLGPARITATIVDDGQAFAFPARWQIAHDSISELLACTPTYTGQAFRGETIEAAGVIEQLESGRRRLVVGDSREANGQWIKVDLRQFD